MFVSIFADAQFDSIGLRSCSIFFVKFRLSYLLYGERDLLVWVSDYDYSVC